MTYEIFKTDDYLLVIDNSEIKEGDYRMNLQRGYVKLVDDAAEYYNQRNDVFKKVIAHLPLNNSPILDGVDLLPPLEQEDDVEKMAHKYNPVQKLDNEFIRAGFKAGYNKAKEKYRFTEEDIAKAVMFGRWGGTMKIDYEKFIQSLSQPKIPIAFEQGNTVNDKTYTSVTRRADGFTLWIGKYIY